MAKPSAIIDIKDIKRQLNGIVKDQAKAEKELDRRTLNAVSKKALTEMSRDINREWGVPVGQVKRRVRVINATNRSLVIEWRFKGRRLVQPGLRQIKRKGGGVSFLGRGRVRKKQTAPISAGGSAPFVIIGRYSGKKVAVFSYGKAPKGKNKAVKTFIGHSIPYYAGANWEARLRERMIELFPEERKKQKKKMDFVKSRRSAR